MLKFATFNTIQVVGGITILIYIVSLANGARQVKIRNFYCKVLDRELGEFLECFVKPIKRDVSEINVNFRLMKPINDNLLLNIYINKRGNAQMYNFSINCCKYLENRKKYPKLGIFFKMLGFESHSNINHSCPYKDNVFLKGYRMDEQQIRFIPIPYGEYILSLHWYYLNKLVIQNDVSFLFSEKYEIPKRSYTVKSIV